MTCLLMSGLEDDGALKDPVEPPGQETIMEFAGRMIGRYRLLEVIGEGGFGVVWRAEQAEPVRRQVALKIIKLGMDTRAVVARFAAERQALALMDHPNIARVFDGGSTDTGRPYFVMELVPGEPLTGFCDARRLSTHGRLELFIDVCRAVQHAHQKGVIHRDLKPSNVLVIEQDGRPVPKVIDFGIARATTDPLSDRMLYTRHHHFLGTLAYMSPEQAGLGGLDIDTRSDVYSLGVMLYELLTGRTPVEAGVLGSGQVEAALRMIREMEPARPSHRVDALQPEELAELAARHSLPPAPFARGLQGEIDWIVLKALDRDRARRYQSSQELAGDLRRFLNHEPVSAVPPALGYQLAKLARRHRPFLISAAAFLLLLLAGLIATGWQALRANRHLKQARLNAYASEIHLAQQALEDHHLLRAKELLDRQRPESKEAEDLRGFEWRYLWQLTQPNALETFHEGGPSQAVAFSPDGTWLATAATDIRIRETASRRIVATLPGGALSLAFSPREKLLAAGEAGQVQLWSTETWTPARAPLSGGGYPARFSPDGAWLVTGEATGRDLRHRLWRTDTWEVVATCPATPELPSQLRNAVAFSPDGTLLVTPWLKTTDGVCGLRLWKVPTLEPVTNLFLSGLSAWSAAFTADGRHLLIGTFLGDVVTWDLQTREIVGLVKDSNAGINSISVAAGAGVFATTSHDQRVSLWDATARQVVARFQGHLSTSWASALSPDGRLLATGSFDGTTQLWDGTARNAADSVRAGSMIAGFSGGGGTLVLAPREGDPRWHLFGPQHSTVEISPDPPLRWNYVTRPYDIFGDLPTGALGRTDGSIELWDLAAGVRTAAWRAAADEITAASFSRDGTRLATGSSKGWVKVWDVSTRKELATFEMAANPGEGSPVTRLVFSPDGRNLACGCWPWAARSFVLWDLATQAPLFSLSPRDGIHNVTTIAFSPDGRLLAFGSMGPNSIQLWDLPSGRRHKPLESHVTGIADIAFSPDGRTLATGGYDTVKLWNVATEQEIANLPYRGTFRSLNFSPDGRTLAVGYLTFPGHCVRLYSAPSLEEIAEAEKRVGATNQPPSR